MAHHTVDASADLPREGHDPHCDVLRDGEDGAGAPHPATTQDGPAVSHDGPAASDVGPVWRPSSTFKRRRRRLSAKRQAELETWAARCGLAETGEVLDLPREFGRSADVFVDVGFGHGETTIELASSRPDIDVIGIEVHDPGVVTVLDAAVNIPLPNVRVVHGDLLPFLGRLAPGSLAGVCVFFPDPWPKPRQRHRRLVDTDIVTALTDRLRPGGALYIATDIADYADQMLAACADERRLDGGPTDRPDWRPLTRFERRGLDEGRQIIDLCFHRRDGADE